MKHRIFLLLLFISLLSCINNTSNKDKNSEVFSNYLENTFNINIGEATHYFIILPTIGCKGCMQRAMPDILKIIKDKNISLFTFILSNQDIIPISNISGYKVLFDKDDVISKMNLRISGITIIKTKNHKVDKTFYVQDETVDAGSFLKFINE